MLLLLWYQPTVRCWQMLPTGHQRWDVDRHAEKQNLVRHQLVIISSQMRIKRKSDWYIDIKMDITVETVKLNLNQGSDKNLNVTKLYLNQIW